MLSSYQQTVRRLSESAAPAVAQGEAVNPYVRGRELGAKVIIFGTAALIPQLLILLAIVGLVMAIAHRLAA
jgi:hypothetical protein